MFKISNSIKYRFLNLFHKMFKLRIIVFNYYLVNIKSLIQKRLIVKSIPICNQKFILSGEGNLKIGFYCFFGYKMGGHFRNGCVEIQPRYSNSVIVIGNSVKTNNNLFICAANYIEIGDNTLIGNNVTIMDHEAHGMGAGERDNIGEIGRVIIGKNVWIGNNVTILKNSEIGENSIVATGAIVSGTFPSNVIIGGIPARIIRYIVE